MSPQLFTLSPANNDIALGARGPGNESRSYVLDRNTFAWLDASAATLPSPVNQINLAEDGSGLVAAVQNTGGVTTSLWRLVAGTWMEVTADFTGSIGLMESLSSQGEAYFLTRVPNDQLFLVGASSVTPLVGAGSGESFAGLTRNTGSGAIAMGWFQDGSFAGVIEVNAEGATRVAATQEDGSPLPVPPSSSLPKLDLSEAGGELRLFFTSPEGELQGWRLSSP